LVLSFTWPPWCLLVMFVCYCARAVAVLAVVQCETCEHCSPGTTPWSSAWHLLAAVVLPAQASHAVTKLLVSCLSPWLDLILAWPCCELLCVHLTCTQWFIRSDTTLGHTYSVMQWQIICPSLRVKPLTLNLYSYSFV
jgi:hypothetical protein